MSPRLHAALLAPLEGAWRTVQERGAAAADTLRGATGAEHEWGPAAMVEHIADSRELHLDPFGTIHFPQLPTIHIGGIAIDLSITKHVFFLMVATVLTILTMTLAARAARRLEHGESAPKGILNTMEVFYLYLRDDVVMANIGHGGERFVPIVLTTFFFILYSNVLGLVPWGATPTGNITVTASLAVMAMVVIETAGFAELGPAGYAKTIFYLPPGLPGWLKPFVLIIMTPVELIGKFSKILALAIRLFANMTAGHFVLLALLGLILTYGGLSAIGVFAMAGSLALGLFVMFLEIFVAFVQAFIFAMLMAVFIGLIRHAH